MRHQEDELWHKEHFDPIRALEGAIDLAISHLDQPEKLSRVSCDAFTLALSFFLSRFHFFSLSL